MKTISTSAVLAVMTATMGFGALAPVLAQDATPPTAQTQSAASASTERGVRHGPGFRHGGGFGFFNFERGAEAIEIAIVRLSYAIDLTDEQTTLLEALKTDALAAAAAFDTATEDLRPTTPANGDTAGTPDISERFNDRIAFETARLEALQAVQPAFNAFFDSLSDEQKADLAPKPGKRMAGMGKHLGLGFGHGPHGGMFQHRIGPGHR